MNLNFCIIYSSSKLILKYIPIIVNVAKKSSAEKAGLEPGDFIIRVNKINIEKPSDIRKIILENDLRSGDALRLEIYRDGKLINKKMKLGKFVK